VYVSGTDVKGIVHVYLKTRQLTACVARLNKHKLDKEPWKAGLYKLEGICTSFCLAI